jgi:hypothetical protein
MSQIARSATLCQPLEEGSRAFDDEIPNFSADVNMAMASEQDVESPFEAGEPPSKDNCDKKDGTEIAISSMSKLAGQTVAPFLAKHIPASYAPLGKKPLSTMTSQKNPNTKYCYRHRPDSKCRRTADEPTMEKLQVVCTL